MNKSYSIALLFILFSSVNSFANDEEARVAKGFLDRGIEYVENRDFNNALINFKECTSVFIDCIHNVGVAYKYQNKLDEAQKWLTLSARYGFKKSMDSLKLINLPVPDNDLQKEHKANQKIGNITENQGRVQLELGKIESDFDKSNEHFKKCVFDFTGCAYNIGIAYEKRNQLDDALMWYDISARQGLRQAKERLIFHNKTIPDNDLEREFRAKQNSRKSAESSQGLWDAINAIISGYNRGADSVLRNRPRNASCTTIGNTTDCYEY